MIKNHADGMAAAWDHSEQEFAVNQLKERIAELENAIRVHRDAQSHEMCWLNDSELYAVLHENLVDSRPTLPPRDEFLTNCEKYYQSRLITLRSPPPKFDEDAEE